MKKIVLSILVSLGLVTILPVAAFADAGITIVGGTVCTTIVNCGTPSGVPVSGANVTVKCDGNTQTATTSVNGQYGVEFNPSTLCPDGSKATVSASKGPENGSNSGTVNQEGDLALYVAIVNVAISVPEFGAITGVAALALGAGAFLVIRRRNLASHKS